MQEPYPVFPPTALVEPCYPTKPNPATIENVIIAQHSAILQCNAQLDAIRAWGEDATEDMKTQSKN